MQSVKLTTSSAPPLITYRLRATHGQKDLWSDSSLSLQPPLPPPSFLLWAVAIANDLKFSLKRQLLILSVWDVHFASHSPIHLLVEFLLTILCLAELSLTLIVSTLFFIIVCITLDWDYSFGSISPTQQWDLLVKTSHFTPSNMLSITIGTWQTASSQ